MGNRYNYRVYVKPKDNLGNYLTELDITDRVLELNLGKFGKSIDSTDYGIGVYTFGDFSMACDNQDGYFGDQHESRSIFPASRDQAKVRVEFETIQVTLENGRVTDSTITTTDVYKGIINEDATRENPGDYSIRFRVLSYDSVIRRGKVPPGAVPNNSPSREAFSIILNRDEITSVLNYSEANINPAKEFTIDIGTAFDSIPVVDALRQLVLASDSIFIIDSNDNIIVKARGADDTQSTLNLYGPNTGRCNIIDVEDFNNGFHRLFTSVKVNQTVSTNEGYVKEFGFRQKSITLDFVTNEATEREIAAKIAGSFKMLRDEITLTVTNETASGSDLLQPVSIDYPLKFIPTGDYYPVLGRAELGDSTEPLPRLVGNLDIKPNKKFIIIEIEEDPKNLIKRIKLRQVGDTYGEGYF